MFELSICLKAFVNVSGAIAGCSSLKGVHCGDSAKPRCGPKSDVGGGLGL